MISTQAVLTDGRDDRFDAIMFKVLCGKTQILEFEWPVMSRETLKSIIETGDGDDQDDDGFRIELQDGKAHITINHQPDVTNDITITLPFEACVETFRSMLPMYKRIRQARNEAYGEEYEQESNEEEGDDE